MVASTTLRPQAISRLHRNSNFQVVGRGTNGSRRVCSALQQVFINPLNRPVRQNRPIMHTPPLHAIPRLAVTTTVCIHARIYVKPQLQLTSALPYYLGDVLTYHDSPPLKRTPDNRPLVDAPLTRCRHDVQIKTILHDAPLVTRYDYSFSRKPRYVCTFEALLWSLSQPASIAPGATIASSRVPTRFRQNLSLLFLKPTTFTPNTHDTLLFHQYIVTCDQPRTKRSALNTPPIVSGIISHFRFA